MQATAGLGEVVGFPEDRYLIARIGHRAEHARPRVEQADPDRRGSGESRGPRQGVAKGVGQQFGYDHTDVVSEVRHSPAAQGHPGEVPGGLDRSEFEARRAGGDPR